MNCKAMEAYPLTWPSGWKRTKEPIDSRFGKYNNRPSVAKGRDEVMAEVYRLCGPNEHIISTNMRVCRYGFLWGNQKEPDDSGVAIYFQYNKQPMVIACDTYKTVGENLTAIARTIEGLRIIQRHGASDLLTRAFIGFKALPEAAPDQTTIEDAFKIMEIPWQHRWSWTSEGVNGQYKKLAMQFHPDMAGGDTIKMQQLNVCRDMILKYISEK